MLILYFKACEDIRISIIHIFYLFFKLY